MATTQKSTAIKAEMVIGCKYIQRTGSFHFTVSVSESRATKICKMARTTRRNCRAPYLLLSLTDLSALESDRSLSLYLSIFFLSFLTLFPGSNSPLHGRIQCRALASIWTAPVPAAPLIIGSQRSCTHPAYLRCLPQAPLIRFRPPGFPLLPEAILPARHGRLYEESVWPSQP